MSKTLVVLGHPNPESLCAAIAEAYALGARDAGAEVEVLRVGELDFDPVLRAGYRDEQSLEPDLIRAQEQLLAAAHLCVVTPIWWGSYPAVLKGFIDRTFLPGFAFRYAKPGRQVRLLKGRSARLIVTGDSPWFWLKFVVGDSTVAALRNGTLKFSGYAPVKLTRLSPVRGSSDEQRAAWIEKAAALGRADHRRPR
jgi:NAD(P)H dehydrogenase (quinone)